jgi:hypothetical protein
LVSASAAIASAERVRERYAGLVCSLGDHPGASGPVRDIRVQNDDVVATCTSRLKA